MKIDLSLAVTQAMPRIDREYRASVYDAFRNSDGTMPSFQTELSAMVWENPELPVQDILDILVAQN